LSKFYEILSVDPGRGEEDEPFDVKVFEKGIKKQLRHGGAIADPRVGGTPVVLSFFSVGLVFSKRRELLSKFNLEREVILDSVVFFVWKLCILFVCLNPVRVCVDCYSKSSGLGR